MQTCYRLNWHGICFTWVIFQLVDSHCNTLKMGRVREGIDTCLPLAHVNICHFCYLQQYTCTSQSQTISINIMLKQLPLLWGGFPQDFGPGSRKFAGRTCYCISNFAFGTLHSSGILTKIQRYTWRIAYVDLRKPMWTQNSHADHACWGKLELAQTRWLPPVQVPCVTTTPQTSVFFKLCCLCPSTFCSHVFLSSITDMGKSLDLDCHTVYLG